MKILSLKKPDVLISDNGGYPGGITCFLAVIIGRLCRPKMSVALLIHHAPDSGKNFMRIYADMLSFFIKCLKIRLITVSCASKKILEAYTPLRDFKVIYNGLESFVKVSKHVDLRKNYSIDDSRLILGMMGPIEPHKGHALLLNVFRISELLRSKACILFIGKGSGQIEKSLKEMVCNTNLSKFVTFTGFLSGNPKDIIKQFDILVMPTIDFEGFGYSMAEAMTQGVPVVASRVGAIPEVIKDGQSGILVDPKDINQLKVALEELVVNPKYREEIGLEGKRRIESNFSAKQMAQEYYNLLVSNLVN